MYGISWEGACSFLIVAVWRGIVGGEGGREGAGRGYYTALTTTQGIYPDLKCFRGNHSYKKPSFRLVMDQELFSHVIVDRFLDFLLAGGG